PPPLTLPGPESGKTSFRQFYLRQEVPVGVTKLLVAGNEGELIRMDRCSAVERLADRASQKRRPARPVAVAELRLRSRCARHMVHSLFSYGPKSSIDA